MLFRAIVFLHGAPALVAGLGTMTLGWWLFDNHFGDAFGTDWRLALQAKSLILLVGAGFFAFGALALAALRVGEPRARNAIALGLLAGDIFGCWHALAAVHNFGRNVYSSSLLALYVFLALASFVLVLSGTLAFAVPRRESVG